MSSIKYTAIAESLSWKKGDKINISGYAFCEKKNIDTDEKVKKSIRISNGKKTYVISAKNKFREDISELYGEDKYNYDYSGFTCEIDAGFLDEMKPLDEGKWNIQICINADGNESIENLVFKNIFASLDEKCIYDLNNNKIHKVMVKSDPNGNLYIVSKVENLSSIDKLNIKKNRFIKKSKLIKFIKKKIKLIKGNSISYLYNIFSIFPIKENKVAFLTDSRGGLYGNFRMVYEELERRGKYDIKYICKPHDNMKKTIIEKIKIVYL